MDLQLKGKIALVTGGSEGIGKGIARALAREGCDIAMCARRKEPLEATAEEIRKEGGGRVVNLIGNDGVKESYWEIVPGACNAAGQNLTKALASQYGKYGISLCAVNPGPVRTERWTGLVKAMSRDMKLPFEQADKLAPRSIPLGRI